MTKNGKEWNCTADDEYLEPHGKPGFEERALAHFKDKGWQIEPVHLCPYCVDRNPEEED